MDWTVVSESWMRCLRADKVVARSGGGVIMPAKGRWLWKGLGLGLGGRNVKEDDGFMTFSNPLFSKLYGGQETRGTLKQRSH